MSLFATEFHRGFRGFTFTYTKNYLFFFFFSWFFFPGFYFGIFLFFPFLSLFFFFPVVFSRRSSSPISRQRKGKKKNKGKRNKKEGKKGGTKIKRKEKGKKKKRRNLFTNHFGSRKTPFRLVSNRPPNTSRSTRTSRNTCINIHTGCVPCIYAYIYSYTYKGCFGGGGGGLESSFCSQIGL